jgi:metal-responsive CopG/Arc/MetJ family transcriptional regulator
MRRSVATVSFSLPDDVKDDFNKVFGKRNKSAVIADLMRKAVAEEKRRTHRRNIFHELTRLRASRPQLSYARLRTSGIN